MPIRIRSGAEAAYARYLATKARVSNSDLAIGFELSRAIDPTLLVEGGQFYPPLLQDLANATSSIHIIEFGIRPGHVAGRFAEVLIAKAREGILVRIIVDSRGSDPKGQSRELFEELASAGIELFVNNPFAPRVPCGPLGAQQGSRWNIRNLLAVDHRKFIIVDGRVGWLGTAGLEDRFEDGRHHDLFVRLEGPVLHQMQAVFMASYFWIGGSCEATDIDRLFPEIADHQAGIPALVLHNSPGRYRPISKEITTLLSSARRQLDVMNPYVADPGTFKRLIAAARRGVNVRLIVPPNEATWSTGYVRLYHHAELVDAGVEIWTYPAVAHAKAFVRDNSEVLVGSCNLETWSLRRFFEIDMKFQSYGLADQFRTKLFDTDIERSTPAQPPNGVRDHVVSTAFYLISPLL